MRQSLLRDFLGTYPGLTVAQIDFIAQVIREFVVAKTGKP